MSSRHGSDLDIEPTLAELEEGRTLAGEGWIGVSNRHCRLARLLPQAPRRVEDLLRPEFHKPIAMDSAAGARLLDIWQSMALRFGGPSLVEYRMVSVGVYRAFRRAGGKSAL